MSEPVKKAGKKKRATDTTVLAELAGNIAELHQSQALDRLNMKLMTHTRVFGASLDGKTVTIDQGQCMTVRSLTWDRSGLQYLVRDDRPDIGADRNVLVPVAVLHKNTAPAIREYEKLMAIRDQRRVMFSLPEGTTAVYSATKPLGDDSFTFETEPQRIASDLRGFTIVLFMHHMMQQVNENPTTDLLIRMHNTETYYLVNVLNLTLWLEEQGA